MPLFSLPVRTALAGVMVFLVIGATAACALVPDYPSGSWRYKLTVQVETPQGVKTGSVVREISATSRPALLGENRDTFVKVEASEAVVVDLGARGRVFGLNRGAIGGGDHAIWVLFKALPPPCVEGPVSRCGIKYYSSLKTATPVDLTPDNLPMFVRFRDLADPKTVEAVKADDFAASFGEGVELKSVTIEMTREPVTIGVMERYLTWIAQRAKYPGAIGGDPHKPFEDPTKTWLTLGDFRTRKN